MNCRSSSTARAGLIAYEAEQEDKGVEGRPTDTSYLPEYSLINIEASIARAVLRLLVLVTLGVVAAIAAGIAALNQHLLGSVVSLLWLFGILIGCGFYFRILFKLLWRRRQALGTPARTDLSWGRSLPDSLVGTARSRFCNSPV